MISEDSLKQLSHIFCGDVEGYYTYKSGSKLVGFFNQYYQRNDSYGQGFPSRWIYVYDRLVELLNQNKFNSFLNIILNKSYLMVEQGLSEVEAAEKSQFILAEMNRILRTEKRKITKKGEKYSLVDEDDDLVFVGSGGFANVYRQKSTGLIIKKLKEDFLTDKGICSRFKREYEITKGLHGTPGIIEVYSFDPSNMSYSMEEAETTLEKFVLNNELTDTSKINCIRQILNVLNDVHEKDIIHRDLSPNNIFIISGMLKIADFGLGKDLKVFASHQTLHTNAVGQYSYCAPEQFMMLKDGDKKSDVYSLGRIINFIMTGNPMDPHHKFRNVSEKATNTDSTYRYADSGQLLHFFEKSVEYNNKSENQKRIEQKISSKQFDDEIENYIYNLTAEEIARKMQSYTNGFLDALLRFMSLDDTHAEYVVQSVDKAYQIVAGRSYEAYDPYSLFAKKVLLGKFSFVVKEIAANILRYVAWDVRRFSAQDMVEEIIKEGVEPMLEEIISS